MYDQSVEAATHLGRHLVHGRRVLNGYDLYPPTGLGEHAQGDVAFVPEIGHGRRVVVDVDRLPVARHLLDEPGQPVRAFAGASSGQRPPGFAVEVDQQGIQRFEELPEPAREVGDLAVAESGRPQRGQEREERIGDRDVPAAVQIART